MGKKEQLLEELKSNPSGITAKHICEKLDTSYPASIIKSARQQGHKIVSRFVNGKDVYILRHHQSKVKTLGIKSSAHQNQNMLQRLGENDRKMYFDYIQKSFFYKSSAEAMLSALQTRIQLETEQSTGEIL